MEDLELYNKFCDPIVSDEILVNPLITPQFYKQLLIERNCSNLCAWCKCPHHIQYDDNDNSGPVFCSTDCQFYSQQFLASLSKPSPKISVVGPIVEKFSDQRPPKPLKSCKADDIEGHRVRVGPYRDNLNEIEKWFGGFPVATLNGLTPDQEVIFELVNKTLRPFSVTFNKSPDVIFYFGNMNIGNVKAVTEADEVFQKAFSIAIFDLLTQNDVSPILKSNNITNALYDDVFDIVSQGAEDSVI